MVQLSPGPGVRGPRPESRGSGMSVEGVGPHLLPRSTGGMNTLSSNQNFSNAILLSSHGIVQEQKRPLTHPNTRSVYAEKNGTPQS